MKSIVFVLFAVALSMSLRSDFSAFEARYGKNYLPSERAFRAKVFEYNMKWAREMNAQDHPYTVGATPFADMTNTEFATSKMCGCMLKPTMTKVSKYINVRPFEEVDWREKGAVTPVKDQASCGSCWAFSATGSLEGGNFVANGKLISLSEQQLVDCDPKSNGCGGGLMTNAFEYVMKKGLCTEEDYPYHAKDEDCKDDKCTVAVQSVGKVQLPQGDEESLANAVALTPVSIVLDASAMQLYKEGIITKCSESINHAVLAVGYGVEEETGIKYWIVKNSWGTSWGEEGYCRIEKDVGGMGRCAITYSSVYPTF